MLRFKGPDGEAVDNAANVHVADACDDTIWNITPEGMARRPSSVVGRRFSRFVH